MQVEVDHVHLVSGVIVAVFGAHGVLHNCVHTAFDVHGVHFPQTVDELAPACLAPAFLHEALVDTSLDFAAATTACSSTGTSVVRSACWPSALQSWWSCRPSPSSRPSHWRGVVDLGLGLELQVICTVRPGLHRVRLWVPEGLS